MRAVLKNETGFTLIEALIAIVVLSVGILVVGAMQTGSIRANATASARSTALAVSDSFMEVFKQLPFDAGVLSDADGDGLDGIDDAGGEADYLPQRADFENDGVLALLSNSFSVVDDASGRIVDSSGRSYTVYWNVADQVVAGGGEAKTIRLFVRWTAPMGSGSSVTTCVKYKNISL